MRGRAYGPWFCELAKLRKLLIQFEFNRPLIRLRITRTETDLS